MELRHLRYLVAVAQELHLRRAAERRHVAQHAVSEQVRKLEDELRVRLVDRTHRNAAGNSPTLIEMPDGQVDRVSLAVASGRTEHPTVAPLRAASRTLGQRPPITSERSVIA
jgi:hypothetical protein